MKSLLQLVGLLAALAASAQGTFEAIQDFTPGSVTGTVQGTGGWSFQPQQDIAVTALGCLDIVITDNGTIDIGLWTDAGTLLDSQVIAPTNTLVNATRYSSITPLILNAGQIYRIGAYAISGLGLSGSAVSPGGTDGSVTLASDILLGSYANSAASTFGFPSNLGAANTMLLGPNFQYHPTIPEPASLAFFVLAGLSCACFRARARD